MTPKYKNIFSLLGIFLLALAAFWIVYPKGSRINLKPVKLPFEQHYKINLGLDLQGGSHLVYQANFNGVEEKQRVESLNGIRDVIERRVNSFGVSEPLVAVSGDNKIIVELPGISDINEAIKLIGETPQLEFRIQSQEAISTQPDEQGKIVVDPSAQWVSTGLSGKQLKRASVDIQQGHGLNTQVVVRLEFNEEGKELFSQITSQNLGKPVAILLDGQIISAPTVQNAITDGTAIISGNFNPDEAKLLVRRLNSGALPVPIELVSQQNIGATLGKESVQKSLVAGFVGVILIIIFMLAFYRLPGLLAAVALFIYTLIAFAIFKIGISFTAVVLVGLFFYLSLTVNSRFGILALISYLGLMFLSGLQPVTLTLAGIAGFILSIGMAVDSNVLMFERMREELRAGKTPLAAVDSGYDKALLTIVDSHVTTLITAAVLFQFGTGPIKGFAVTLFLGVAINLFTALIGTKTVFDIINSRGEVRRLSI